MNAELEANSHRNLLNAVEGIAKYHQREVADVIVYMDSPVELLERWYGAYIKRDWFLSMYSAQQRDVLKQFQEQLTESTSKYNNLPPLHKFFGSQAGRAVASAAADLAVVLRSGPACSG